MPKRDKKEPHNFSASYKKLPLMMRVKVNMTARELLEIQRKNETSIKNTEEADSGGNGGNSKIGMRNE